MFARCLLQCAILPELIAFGTLIACRESTVALHSALLTGRRDIPRPCRVGRQTHNWHRHHHAMDKSADGFAWCRVRRDAHGADQRGDIPCHSAASATHPRQRMVRQPVQCADDMVPDPAGRYGLRPDVPLPGGPRIVVVGESRRGGLQGHCRQCRRRLYQRLPVDAATHRVRLHGVRRHAGPAAVPARFPFAGPRCNRCDGLIRRRLGDRAAHYDRAVRTKILHGPRGVGDRRKLLGRLDSVLAGCGERLGNRAPFRALVCVRGPDLHGRCNDHAAAAATVTKSERIHRRFPGGRLGRGRSGVS